MRKESFVTGSYYHVYNRGVDKRDIFNNQKDVDRFLLSMNLFSYKTPTQSIQIALRDSVDVGRLQDEKLVSFVMFCLNPNHFHFLLKQEVEGGISEFMKRLQGGYTKYFNEKNKRSGSLFQGKFKSSFAEKENYFELLCGYVMWNDKMHDIPQEKLSLVYSSVNEYKTQNYFLIDKKEAENIINVFGSFENLTKHASEIIHILREGRGKAELSKDRFIDL